MFGLSWVSLAAYAVVAALLFGGGFKLSHDLDQGTIQHMRADAATAAAQAQAQARRIEDQQAALSQVTGAAEASAQEALQAKARVITKEITHYVTPTQDAHGCVTWGMLRVHDAAALGVDPASLQPPAGQSDDACAPVEPSAFAAAVAGNYAIAHQNAEQLDALEADVRQRVADFNAGQPDKHSGK